MNRCPLPGSADGAASDRVWATADRQLCGGKIQHGPSRHLIDFRCSFVPFIDCLSPPSGVWAIAKRSGSLYISPMRIWLFSDLHVEFSRSWDLPLPSDDFDLIVAAGDIHCPASSGVRWLAERAGGKPVIYVPGNHEWYSVRRDFCVAEESRRAAELADELGIHWLMNREVVVGGVRFLGATLWTDYALYEDVGGAMRVAEHGLNDHRYVFPDKRMEPLRALEARAWHEQSRHWLMGRFIENREPTVVVTHHLPHPRSIHDDYTGSSLNPAFCSDLASMVEGSGAALWIHGHTHKSCDYRAGATRVVCNPKGYGPISAGSWIENPEFNPALMVDLT